MHVDSSTRRGRVSRRPWQWLRREAPPLALMLLLLCAARDTLANHYQVPSGSMQPTLQPGDRIVVDMRAYGLRLPFSSIRLLDTGHPRRGDVAVFDSPADGTRLVKRVVAVAGDRVELRDGHLSINGVPMADAADPQAERILRDAPPLVTEEAAGGGQEHPMPQLRVVGGTDSDNASSPRTVRVPFA